MKLIHNIIFIHFILILSCGSPNDEHEKVVKISAAVSLTDVLTEISKRFEMTEGIRVQLNFSSSSILARQIANGLNSDLYLSANPQWMQYLVDNNCIENSSVREIFSNSLVIVLPADSKFNISSINDLQKSQIQKIAIGDPSHVPAGLYAKETLENAGIWEAVRSKMVGAIDVRAALAFVQNRSVDCAIVYGSDVYQVKDFHLVFRIPEKQTPDIKYMGGIVKNGKKDLAQQFLTFLNDSVQNRILIKYGFKPI